MTYILSQPKSTSLRKIPGRLLRLPVILLRGLFASRREIHVDGRNTNTHVMKDIGLTSYDAPERHSHYRHM